MIPPRIRDIVALAMKVRREISSESPPARRGRSEYYVGRRSKRRRHHDSTKRISPGKAERLTGTLFPRIVSVPSTPRRGPSSERRTSLRPAADNSGMDSPRSRLTLGIAAVALVVGLCIVAVWSVRGRLPGQPAPVAAAHRRPPMAALRAENLRLRAQVARLTSERDAALTKSRAPESPASYTGPIQIPAVPQPRAAAEKPAAPQSGDFTEPQTFSSVSTSN